MDAHVQECTEVCGVIYFQRGALVQGAAAGVGMRKPLSGDSGFFIFIFIFQIAYQLINGRPNKMLEKFSMLHLASS